MARPINGAPGPPTSPTRQDQWLVVAGLKYQGNSYPLGPWDKKTGGELDSDDNKYYPGGVNITGPISLGGRKTTGNVVLSRIWDRDTDEQLLQHLYDAVGKGVVTIITKSKDDNGVATGLGIQHQGTLKRVLAPDFDSESGTAAMFEIEVIVANTPFTGTKSAAS